VESQHAGGSIARLIADMRTGMARAVAAVEGGARRTTEGAATVAEARRDFQVIGASIDETANRVEAIAEAVEAMADAANRMSTDMTQVAEVAEQSSAMTEQVSASTQQSTASVHEIAGNAQQLAATAGNLEQLVRRFTLS
jgi:methyl-accepting chemotaxis protein